MSPSSPDPRPGDFDDDLSVIAAASVQIVEPSRERDVSIQVVVSGDEALTLERIAHSRGKEPNEIVADLIREAADRAA